jgi:hypothetical protein
MRRRKPKSPDLQFSFEILSKGLVFTANPLKGILQFSFEILGFNKNFCNRMADEG